MEEEDREPFVRAMSGAIGAAKQQAAAEKVIGTLIGIAAVTFLLPLLVVYAWNNMTPESFPEWHYWSVAAAFFVVRILLFWVKS